MSSDRCRAKRFRASLIVDKKVSIIQTVREDIRALDCKRGASIFIRPRPQLHYIRSRSRLSRVGAFNNYLAPVA